MSSSSFPSSSILIFIIDIIIPLKIKPGTVYALHSNRICRIHPVSRDRCNSMEQINIQIWELQGSAKKYCFMALSFILSSQSPFHQSATNACSNTVNSVVIRQNVALGIFEPSKECFRPFTTTTVPRILNARTQLKLKSTRLFMTTKNLDENCLALHC